MGIFETYGTIRTGNRFAGNAADVFVTEDAASEATVPTLSEKTVFRIFGVSVYDWHLRVALIALLTMLLVVSIGILSKLSYR